MGKYGIYVAMEFYDFEIVREKASFKGFITAPQKHFTK